MILRIIEIEIEMIRAETNRLKVLLTDKIQWWFVAKTHCHFRHYPTGLPKT